MKALTYILYMLVQYSCLGQVSFQEMNSPSYISYQGNGTYSGNEPSGGTGAYYFKMYVSNGPSYDVQVMRKRIAHAQTAFCDELQWIATPEAGWYSAPEMNVYEFLIPDTFSLAFGDEVQFEFYISTGSEYGELEHLRYFTQDLNGVKLDSIDIVVSIDNSAIEEVDQWIAFGPNPCSEFLTISPIGSLTGTFKLYALTGELKHSGELHESTEIDVRNFAPGIYFLNYEVSGYGSGSKKIILQ